ncbi:MAG: hypothetical protein ACE5H1_12665 [Thermodesulfobacteriota bacterium]
MVIKSVLREELQNSKQMKERYERELAKLPKGSLQKREIKGNHYYYHVYRDNGKFVANYKSKVSDLPKNEVKRWKEIKEKRAQYRSSISKLKKQIRYLNGVLRGREEF